MTMPLRSPVLAVFLLFLTSLVRSQTERTFRHDRGQTFTITGTPKVAVRAGIGGVSLYHMGLPADQLTAVWGLWGIRGSDFDPENPAAGSDFPDQDPGVPEAEFLASAVNLSPSCWKNTRGCFRWDNITDLVDLQDEIDYLLFIDNGSADEDYVEAEELGFQVIFIDTFYDFNVNCRLSNFTVNDETQCFGRSMIDITQRIEELAIALGVDTSGVAEQKATACATAMEFTETMKEVHEKGLRVKVSIVGTDTNQDTGADIFTVRDFDPISLWVPRTLEELGMPLLHADTYDGEGGDSDIPADDYFVDCPAGQVDESCNGNTLFPVDYWLIDSRSYRLIEGDLAQSVFPDKALLAGQFWQYARNDGALSYVRIDSMLRGLITRLSTATLWSLRKSVIAGTR